MDYNDLTEEQKAKAKACKSAEELAALAEAEGIEISIDELDAVSGGGWGGNCDNEIPPDDLPGAHG